MVHILHQSFILLDHLLYVYGVQVQHVAHKPTDIRVTLTKKVESSLDVFTHF